MSLDGLTSSAWFWVGVIFLGSALLGAAVMLISSLPFVGRYMRGFRKGMQPVARILPIVGIIGLVSTLGGIGIFESASLVGAEDVEIVDMQVTTDFTSVTGCTIAEDNNVDDRVNVRCTDKNTGQVNETAAQYEVQEGIITVTRGGNLEPASCTVKAYSADYFSEKTPGDGTVYNIVEVTTLDELEVYLADNSAAATTSQKERIELSFAEGEATETLGVLIELDEDAHDNLNQYSTKDIVLDVCGMPFYFRVWQMST
jgi:hypothetical protein